MKMIKMSICQLRCFTLTGFKKLQHMTMTMLIGANKNVTNLSMTYDPLVRSTQSESVPENRFFSSPSLSLYSVANHDKNLYLIKRNCLNDKMTYSPNYRLMGSDINGNLWSRKVRQNDYTIIQRLRTFFVFSAAYPNVVPFVPSVSFPMLRPNDAPASASASCGCCGANDGLFHRSMPLLGNNLEDYYGVAEFATKMSSPMVEYVWWMWVWAQVLLVIGTLMHSNYYFTGHFLPKPQSNTQLCEDSW